MADVEVSVAVLLVRHEGGEVAAAQAVPRRASGGGWAVDNVNIKHDNDNNAITNTKSNHNSRPP